MHASVNQTITNDPDLLLNSEAGAGEFCGGSGNAIPVERYRFALRRFLDFLGADLREAAVFVTAKSSNVAPAFILSRSLTGCAPLPAHVLPDSSRYFTAALRPFSNGTPSTLLWNTDVITQSRELVLQLAGSPTEYITDIISKLQKHIDRRCKGRLGHYSPPKRRERHFRREAQI